MTMTLVAATLAGAIAAQAAPVNPQAAALSEFTKRLKEYLQLRDEIGRKLEPLECTASATELKVRQQALEAGLRAARAGARQGDLVPLPVQRQIREIVAADFRRREPAARRSALEEVPKGPLPGINRHYPDQAALPTVPPLLLASLPPLPDNLQYRFFGRHVVILDGDVRIVVDYVPEAVPR
ncbi:MAG: hypothetical protein ACRD26_19300 [Vicinamibacterales bacterium]